MELPIVTDIVSTTDIVCTPVSPAPRHSSHKQARNVLHRRSASFSRQSVLDEASSYVGPGLKWVFWLPRVPNVTRRCETACYLVKSAPRVWEGDKSPYGERADPRDADPPAFGPDEEGRR
jgi:hypothetical protein